MLYKWIGAILIVLGCGSFGFSIAASHRKDELSLRQLVSILDYMECELQFHMTPLPDLCRKAGEESNGILRDIFISLSQALDLHLSPDVEGCMKNVMQTIPDPPPQTAHHLRMLGSSLGRFDIKGQLNGLESVRSSCRKALEEMSNNRDNRLRSYQTLGLCGGAALVILFI